VSAVDTLRAAARIARLWGSQRDVLTADLLSEIADVAERHIRQRRNPDSWIVGYGPALRLAELIVGGA
jgi:hypothetical protein